RRGDRRLAARGRRRGVHRSDDRRRSPVRDARRRTGRRGGAGGARAWMERRSCAPARRARRRLRRGRRPRRAGGSARGHRPRRRLLRGVNNSVPSLLGVNPLPPSTPFTLAALVFGALLVETWRAARNEHAQRSRSGVEPPGDVYKLMRIVYPASFLAMFSEGIARGSPPPSVLI